MRIQLELPNEVAAELAGPGDAVMKTLEEHLDCEVFLRGNVLTLDGDDDAVATARTVVREMTDLVRQGHEIAPGTIEAIAGALDRHESPSRILEDVVWRHRGLKVAPKTVNQKRYVDAIRRSTITVGVGPAGTGKSFLAVAMAVAALSRREVNRIVLTRPAVEAGERLGFLPGDIAAKVDPYLRPLFDALYDMLEPEKVNQHLERGVIEVAPLAFMRGRTLERLVHHPRRGAEHEPGADQDVPHAARLQLEDGRDRRHHADRPAEGPALGARDDRRHPQGRGGHRVRALRRRGRGASQARAADRRGLQRVRREAGAAAARRRGASRASATLIELDLIDAPEEFRAAGARRARRGRGRGRPPGGRSSSDADAIRALNREHRNLDRPTDVLSFPVDEGGPSAGPRELGDVVICPEHTEDLIEAVVHGVLHLCGYDHESDDGEMLALQRRVLEEL